MSVASVDGNTPFQEILGTEKTFLPPMVKTVCKENSSMDASVGFMGAWELNLFYMGF